MPPNKGGNAKKEGGRAKKAENEAKKQEAAAKQKEAKIADEWKQGAKSSSKAEMEAAKKAEAAAKKAEREALLAAEEASLPSKPKSAPKAKKAAAKDTIKTNAGVAAFRTDDALGVRRDADRVVPELSAVGIEDMLEALDVVNEKTDDQALGAKAGLIEQHPERRFKAAFNAYLERELPKLKEDHPGLRQNQMRDIIYKQFQKAPENPFNQQSIAYNATKEEKLGALKEKMQQREAKYRVDS